MFKVVYLLRNYLRKLFQKRKWSPKLFMIMFIGDRDKKKFPQEIHKFYYCLSYKKQIYQPLLIETCTEIFSCLKKKNFHLGRWSRTKKLHDHRLPIWLSSSPS